MTKDEVGQHISTWLDGVGTALGRDLISQGFYQGGGDRIFPKIAWATWSTDNVSLAVAALAELAAAIGERQIGAVAALIITLKPVFGTAVLQPEIVLSEEIDLFHPPLFYVLADRARVFAPIGAEIRVPLALRSTMGSGAYCFLVARPVDDAALGGALGQEWDRDIRLVLPASSMPDMRIYWSGSIPQLSI